MSRQAQLRRAWLLAGRLAADLDRLGRLGPTPHVRARLRSTLFALDEALRTGLAFPFRPERDLGLRRGHARNLAMVVRRSVGDALEGDPDARARAGRLARELVETVKVIHGYLPEEDALRPTPWALTWPGALLAVAAWLLPAHERRDFIEDQCANLAQAGSLRERAGYLLSLLAHMPDIAATLATAEMRAD